MQKRILFITHHDGFLGSSKSLLNLLQGLLAYPIQTFVVVPQESLFTEALRKIHIPYKVLPVTNWVSSKPLSLRQKLQWIKKNNDSIRAIKQVVDDWNIKLIYSNSSIFPVGRIVAYLAKIPHIWHIREFGDFDYSLKYIVSPKICLQLIKSSSRIICNSNAVKLHHFKKEIEKISVIYNGIAYKNDFDNFYIRNEQKPLHSFYTFCLVGSISEKKGTEVAIEAINKLKKNGKVSKLIIAGRGSKSYINYCKKIVKDLKLYQNVLFFDYVNDPYDIYFQSDCLLMCSEFEAMGRVTVEGMSACLPVIGKNSGGTPEIIENDKTGYLYNTFDELVESMEKLLVNPSRSRNFGLQGWEKARQKFSIEDYTSQIFEIIKSIT